jgi:hypothetical protein
MAQLLGHWEGYNSQVFQNVPDFSDVAVKLGELDIPKILEKFGKIFAKFGVHKELELFAIHRHFDLEDGEILVEAVSKNGSKSVSLPWKIIGIQIYFYFQFNL